MFQNRRAVHATFARRRQCRSMNLSRRKVNAHQTSPLQAMTSLRAKRSCRCMTTARRRSTCSSRTRLILCRVVRASSACQALLTTSARHCMRVATRRCSKATTRCGRSSSGDRTSQPRALRPHQRPQNRSCLQKQRQDIDPRSGDLLFRRKRTQKQVRFHPVKFQPPTQLNCAALLL